jgi:hypothetical protein
MLHPLPPPLRNICVQTGRLLLVCYYITYIRRESRLGLDTHAIPHSWGNMGPWKPPTLGEA